MFWRIKNSLFFVCGRVIVSTLIFILVFTDISALFQNPFAPKTQIADAANGDFSIFRESSGTETVDSSILDVPWDTSVSASGNISLQSNNSDIDLSEGGKYLVMYNTWTEQGTSTAGSRRRSHESWLTLAGNPLEYGRGGGYLRDGAGIVYSYNSGSAIIDATAGDDLQVHIRRDDANTTAGMNVRGATNGISVLKLKDSWDYLRIHKSSTSTNINGNTTFTDVTWDSSDEVDTGSFGFTPTSADITLKGDDDDHFLVTTNVRLDRTSNSNRENYEMILTLDGVEIPGTRVTAFIRGNSNGNNDFNDALVYNGIIRKDSVGDQTLNVEVRRESSSSGGTTVIMGDQSAISVVALPDEGSYIMLGNDTNPALASTRTNMDWTTQQEVDTYAFSHSTTSSASRINIGQDGDYLFFSTLYATSSNNDNRQPFRADWKKSGSVLNYGGFGQYLRDNTSFSTGASGGLIIDNLTTSDYVELAQFDEATTPDALFVANKIALQGILLDENFFGVDVTVSATGTQEVSTNKPATNFEMGGKFVIQENTGSRNITSITLTESGTIDGLNDLDNIKIYYDLDTSNPYNCASESYEGGETQFGSTDTSGFSGADGVSGFTGSAAISTTQTFCGYVVYDVLETANDGDTIDISIDDPSVDVEVSSSGSVGPISSVSPTSFTTVSDPELTQIHYHWRNDDGSETSATSLTGGIEDTIGNGFQPGTVRRLRVEVSVEGSATSSEVQYKLQYGVKGASCSAISTWVDVAEEGGDWDVADSSTLAFGDNTTDVGPSFGGVTNAQTQFIGTSGIIDYGGKSQNTTLNPNEFIELEYTVAPTASASDGTTYCFRVIDGTPDTTHAYRMPIVIQSSQVDDDLTNFPVYVDLADLGSHFFSNVTSDGGDIRVTESDGTTEVAREVVSINTGSETGELHFLAPSISSTTNTTFYIYYDSSVVDEYQDASIHGTHGVWGDYEAVYHLPTTEDSSGNSRTLTQSNVSNSTASKVGTTSADFNGSTSVYTNPDPDLILNGHSAITFTGWIQSDLTATDKGFIIADTIDGSDAGLCSRYDDAGATGGGDDILKGCIDTSGGAAQYETLNFTQTTSWQHVAQTWQSTQILDVYLDGSTAFLTATPTAQTGTTAVGSGTLYIGAGGKDTASGGWDGRIDEIRFASIFRNAAWIGSEYTNQDTPTTFYSTSTEQSVNQTASTIIYDVYPEANITADVTVSATGTQTTNFTEPSENNYVGGKFVITENTASRNVTSITLTASGTLDASESVEDLKILYDLDTSSPYNCLSESLDGGESQFGATSTSGFSSANGTSTFTGTVGISTTQTMCLYVVLDVNSTSTDGETFDIQIALPNTDVVVSAGSVGPGTTLDIDGVSTIVGPVLTQLHYHWRNDNGDEATASSATNGVEDTEILSVPKESPRRLRVLVSNEGGVSSPATQYRLEYGTKIDSCEAVSQWLDVDVGAAFRMATTSQLVDGNNTFDISTTTGGTTNPAGKTFLSTNGGQKEDDSQTGNITLTSSQFVELEYAIEATNDSGYETSYCFRVTDAGSRIESYPVYPELTTREKQDFFIQRGTEEITGLSQTLTAGVDYIAPSSSTTAFVRITNTQITGAGRNLDVDQFPMSNNQNADDVTVYISDPENIETSFTITRPSTASTTADTSVSWEIVEFIGLAGTDNEMIVRDQGTISYGSSATHATGTSVGNVSDDSDVVVFITGQDSANASNVFYEGLSTASWHSTSSVPVFQRGSGPSNVSRVSYAVVEFTGANWYVQRSEHTYTAAAVTEPEDIEAVNSRDRTFVHAQKRIASTEAGLEEMGHEVWISGLGTMSFLLDDGSNNPGSHTSVAWIIENTQTGNGEMNVRRSNGLLGTGASACSDVEPCLHTINISGDPLGSISNSSIFSNNRSDGNGGAFPRPIIDVRIASTTAYEMWRSDTGQPQNYRTEIVEWPVAELVFRQNYYRFYADNDSIDPTDPWPVGAQDLGENESITVFDDPLAEGEVVRLRTTVAVSNATLPELTKSFKLQYGRLNSTCSAIAVDSTWYDIGDPGSGEIWRGYDGTPADGDTISTILIDSLPSSVFGTYEEQNNSAPNPSTVNPGTDVEYDWVIQHNGALQRTEYCFRLLESDESLLTGYNNYPQLRTTGYTPISSNWRWYDDATSTTPTNPMANENIAPVDVSNENEIKLRVSVHEIENASGANVKFGLQYSQKADFSSGVEWVVASSTCTATSTWCYADGGGIDTTVIDSAVLSDSDSCTGGSGNGCGLYSEGTTTPSTLTQPASSRMEFDFTIKHAAARVNQVYYFRLYDIANDSPVFASSTYPSLVTEGASLSFTMGGLASSTVIEGVTLDIDSTPTTLNFGAIPADTFVEGAHRLSIDSNGTEGYKLLMTMDGDLRSSFGTIISPITGTNAAPVAWSSGCDPGANSCFGYHTSDDTLEGGSTRFSAIDTYARVSTTTLDEVGYNSQPVANESVDVVYRILRRELQEAGLYEARMIYISVPIF